MMGKRTIKMLDSGPNKNHRVGQVLEVDHQRAAHLVDNNHAEYLNETRGRRRAKPTPRD